MILRQTDITNSTSRENVLNQHYQISCNPWQAYIPIVLRFNQEGAKANPKSNASVCSIHPYVMETCFYYDHLSKTQRVLTLGQTSISNHNETASKAHKEGFFVIPLWLSLRYKLLGWQMFMMKKWDSPLRSTANFYLRIRFINAG